ncbi:glycoside hydrolase family 16 protein, partial [Aulographum hederae CBS 113979]
PPPAGQSRDQPPPENPRAYWEPTFAPHQPVSTHFRHELGAHGWGNNEPQNYVASPANSFHTDQGKLVIRAIADSKSSDPFTSARLTSHQTLSRSRGCLAARITLPSADGIWPAFWLLPADPFTWPHDGEIDILESWNGDRVNHSCLHWGFFNGEDWNKHRVVDTTIPSMGRYDGHTCELVWDMPPTGDGGRIIWYLDGQAVMKAEKPPGTRRIEHFRIILNVAMGGNVCNGKVPRDGSYEMVVHELRMCDDPPGGWQRFEQDWRGCKEGRA